MKIVTLIFSMIIIQLEKYDNTVFIYVIYKYMLYIYIYLNLYVFTLYIHVYYI